MQDKSLLFAIKTLSAMTFNAVPVFLKTTQPSQYPLIFFQKFALKKDELLRVRLMGEGGA